VPPQYAYDILEALNKATEGGELIPGAFVGFPLSLAPLGRQFRFACRFLVAAMSYPPVGAITR
jgi:hypothetical protein